MNIWYPKNVVESKNKNKKQNQEARHQKVCVVWFHSNEVQKEIKLISGDRSQNNDSLWEEVEWLEGVTVFSGIMEIFCILPVYLRSVHFTVWEFLS